MCIFLIISRSVFRMKNVSGKICGENQNTHFMVNNFFFYFRKSCRLWDNVERYSKTGQATDDNMAHEHCMLDTWCYKHTLRVCNAYCFTTATMAVWTLLSATLYVQCLLCLLVLHRPVFFLLLVFCLAISHGNVHLLGGRGKAKIIESVEIAEGCRGGKIRGAGIEEF